jgi:putative spermidine/putrescine transport system substrate-binding protein
MRKVYGILGVTAAVSLQLSMFAGAADSVLPPDIRAKVSGKVVLYDVGGGALTKAREETVVKNFIAETGVTFKSDYNGVMMKFFAAMESGTEIPWSVIEFSTKGEFLKARDAGYLERLDPSVVDVSKVKEGSYDEYGIDFGRYGIVLTYNTEKFSGDNAPKSIADIYDLDKFPGKRCLFKYPQFGGVLESALIADGMPREKLYPLDLDRAFAKLDKIKSEIVWWSAGDDSVRLIANGECSMGIAWSGRVFAAVKNDKAPLAIEWQDSLYTSGVYAVPKGAPNPTGGQAFIAQVVGDVEAEKGFVAILPYPTNLVAMENVDLGPELAPWLPAGANAGKAFEENAEYYGKFNTKVVDRFNRWVVQNP